jgi:hypothetical protein
MRAILYQISLIRICSRFFQTNLEERPAQHAYLHERCGFAGRDFICRRTKLAITAGGIGCSICRWRIERRHRAHYGGRIERPTRQSIVVENVTGAGGMAGGTRVARAAPDGYQFVIGNVGSFAQSQWIYKIPPYDVLKDFAPVGLITDESLVLVTRKDFPANNL